LSKDDFLVANEIETALSDAGFEVALVAASADEALELAESQKPALVVMDVRLGGNATEFTPPWRFSGSSGFAASLLRHIMTKHLLERAKPAMPLGWLQKPYSMVSLVNAVRRALEELDRNR